MKSKENWTFMYMPPGCVWGDFNIAFDIRAVLNILAVPIGIHMKKLNKLKKLNDL